MLRRAVAPGDPLRPQGFAPRFSCLRRRIVCPKGSGAISCGVCVPTLKSALCATNLAAPRKISSSVTSCPRSEGAADPQLRSSPYVNRPCPERGYSCDVSYPLLAATKANLDVNDRFASEV